jgi:predicted acylesterase/phospholipase RssA
MAKLTSPQQIRHLALEGGGGKGIAYLGAIRALEEFGLLPLPISEDKRAELEALGLLKEKVVPRIEGVSGSSAGAFTALFLALGFDSSRLAAVLSHPPTFNALYDGPDNDLARHVDRDRFKRSSMVENPLDKRDRDRRAQQGNVTVRPPSRTERSLRVHDFPFSTDGFSFSQAAIGTAIVGGSQVLGSAFLRDEVPIVSQLGPYVPELFQSPGEAGRRLAGDLGRIAALLLFIQSLGPGVKGAISEWIRTFLAESLKKLAQQDPAYAALVNTITKDDATFEKFFYNLLFDRGVFPGFAVRDFLKRQVIDFLRRRGEASDEQELARLADELTFASLYEKTHTDLVVTGVNITTHRPAYFGRKFTPQFPVVDAVAISGCFPFAFKPVLVTRCDRVEDGFWMDGGIANNLPLHAFDEAVDGKLQPGMLALRLEDLGEPSSALPDPELEPAVEQEGLFDVLFAHLGGLFDAIMYPSEEGQLRVSAGPGLRTVDERDQTVKLNTAGLKTLEFAPAFERSSKRIRDSFYALTGYFDQRGSRFDQAIDDLLKELGQLAQVSSRSAR